MKCGRSTYQRSRSSSSLKKTFKRQVKGAILTRSAAPIPISANFAQGSRNASRLCLAKSRTELKLSPLPPLWLDPASTLAGRVGGAVHVLRNSFSNSSRTREWGSGPSVPLRVARGARGEPRSRMDLQGSKRASRHAGVPRRDLGAGTRRTSR